MAKTTCRFARDSNLTTSVGTVDAQAAQAVAIRRAHQAYELFVDGLYRPIGYPNDVDRDHFRLIALFTHDASKWLSMSWIDIYTGRTYAITTDPNADSRLVRVKSYGDVFRQYLTHPEPKSAGADGGLPRGRIAAYFSARR